MNAQIREFYRELDLEAGADLVAVRQSYRQLVKVWHPDRFGHDQKLQAVANDKLKKINFAFESLVAFFESGGKAETSPPPKAESSPKTSRSPSAEEIYRIGIDRYYARDYHSAAHFFGQAAELGDAKAQYAIGFMLYQHTTRNVFTLRKQSKNEHEALIWWHKAAEQGNSNAQYMLGICYQYANSTPYDGTEARKWFERAASSGHHLAKDRLKQIAIFHSIRAVPLAKWVMEAPPGAPLPN